MPFGDPALNEFLAIQKKWETTFQYKLLSIQDYEVLIHSWIQFKRQLASLAARDKFGMQLDQCGQHQLKAKEILRQLLEFFNATDPSQLPDTVSFQNEFVKAVSSCPLSGSPLTHSIFRDTAAERIRAAITQIETRRQAEQTARLHQEQEQRERAYQAAKKFAQEWVEQEGFYQQLFRNTLTTITREKERISAFNANDYRIALLTTCLNQLEAIQTKTKEEYTTLKFCMGKIKPERDQALKAAKKTEIMTLINQQLIINQPLNSWSRKFGRSLLNALMIITLFPLGICYAATGNFLLNRNTGCHRAMNTLHGNLLSLEPTRVDITASR